MQGMKAGNDSAVRTIADVDFRVSKTVPAKVRCRLPVREMESSTSSSTAAAGDRFMDRAKRVILTSYLVCGCDAPYDSPNAENARKAHRNRGR